MKIKSIKINNIGPYVGDNVFRFDVSDKTKRMILIGGKNGSGKTTLFNAIKICLYGCIAYGFKSENIKYYSEIEKIINTNEKLKKGKEAKIILELLLDDGKYDYVYTFDRRWKIARKRIYETFNIYKNDKLLSEIEQSDFESYLLQILPPDLFRFYFFDGEKISDFVFNGNKNTDFKEAFLRICNLDTMEIIRDNFLRVSRNRTDGIDDISNAYDKCREEHNLIENKISCVEDEYKNAADKIIDIDEQLAVIEKTYSKNGGISKKEWKSMENIILKEEIRREEQRKWLKDMANNILPFVIVSKNLKDLKEQIINEYKAQVNINVKSTIHTPEIKSIITDVLKNSGTILADDITEKIIDEILTFVNQTSQTKTILNLSEFDRFELIAKIDNLLAFDINKVKAVTENIEDSLNKTKKVRDKLKNSSVENYEIYLQEKSELNETKAMLSQRLLDIEKNLQMLKMEEMDSASKLAKAKSNYEELIKKQSINDISARALLAFNRIQEVLYTRDIKFIELEFQKNFSSLINKVDLIDGIYIDDNLNVLPYKNKKFKLEEMKKTIEKNGVEYVIGQIGLHAYEILQKKISENEMEFELPVEVKQQLSAGEKQVFIMALYQSLSQLNRINVPYIIDTPFARIDKEHREKILCEFFKKLNGQIIILSTDEEISDKYMPVIKDIVSDAFTLNHTDDGNTEILENTYFGGKL